MKRYEDYGDIALSILTYIPRLCIGIYNAVERQMPAKLECNYEFKRKGYDIVRKKEEKDGNTNTEEKASG